MSFFFAGHEAFLLVENGAHVLVGREQAFHEHVAAAFVDKLHGTHAGFGLVGFLHNLELGGVKAMLLADFPDGSLVTH